MSLSLLKGHSLAEWNLGRRGHRTPSEEPLARIYVWAQHLFFPEHKLSHKRGPSCWWALNRMNWFTGDQMLDGADRERKFILKSWAGWGVLMRAPLMWFWHGGWINDDTVSQVSLNSSGICYIVEPFHEVSSGNASCLTSTHDQHQMSTEVTLKPGLFPAHPPGQHGVCQCLQLQPCLSGFFNIL